MQTSMAQLAAADWEQLEQDVVRRIRALAAVAKGLGRQPHDQQFADRIANDLILPNIQLLAAFCEAVALDETDRIDLTEGRAK